MVIYNVENISYISIGNYNFGNCNKYKQYLKEMFLNEILMTVTKKQIEHLRNIKNKDNFDIETFLRDNVF